MKRSLSHSNCLHMVLKICLFWEVKIHTKNSQIKRTSFASVLPYHFEDILQEKSSNFHVQNMVKLEVILIDFIFCLLTFQIDNNVIFILLDLIFRVELKWELRGWFFRFINGNVVVVLFYVDTLILVFSVSWGVLFFGLMGFFERFRFYLVLLSNFVLVSRSDHGVYESIC